MIFGGKGKGVGGTSVGSRALYRYSTCSLLALLCRGLEQEHAGATLEHLSVNYFLITEQL